jgi:hypothetical protein
MDHELDLPAPPFNINDRVAVVGPSKDSGRTGLVRDIYEFSGLYRFVVAFENGSTGVFFVFELISRST